MCQKLYLLFYLAIVHCANIYPISTTQYQWENMIWVNCGTTKVISPQNCENNDQNWAECYTVPTEGICLQESLKGVLETDITFQFQFYDSVTKDAVILINNKQPKYKLQTDKKIVITTQLDVTKISVQINGSNLKLQNFVVTTYCNGNCKSCNDNSDCTECQEDYSLVNYQCVPDTCFNDLSYLSTKSTQSSSALIDSDNNYSVNLQFNVNLGQCLIPKVYLVPALNSNQIEYVLLKEQIQISKNQLKFYLTLPQIIDHCTTAVDDSEKQIFQCEIGVALTFSKITQFTTFLIGQIRLNLSTSAMSSTTQVITDTSKTVQLNLVNEITQVSVSDKVLTVIQTVYDDAIKTANPVFKSASMKQEGKSYNNLQFSIAQRLDNKIRYRFNIQESSIDFNKEIELNLDASLTSNNRLLTGDRTNLKISYGVNNVYKFLPKELLQSNTSSKEQSYYMVIGVTVFFGLAGILGCYFFLKKEKGILFVEDNKMN